MKRILIGIVIGLIAGGSATWWLRRPAVPEHPAKAEAAAKPEEKPNPLRIPAAKRSAAGIVLAKPQSRSLAPELEAFGRVLDPTPYVALVAEQATARAALAASEKELERVRKLFAAGGNASAQAVETAEAAAVRDRAAVASAQVRLLAGWGKTLTDSADLDTLRDTLAQGAALLRIDLLPGVAPVAAPKTAQVALIGSTERLSVEVLGPAPVADPQVQGVSYLAILRQRSLPAGAALRVSVPAGTGRADVMVIPRSAIVYHQGSPWVYVLGEEDTFERKLAVLGQPVDDAVVISGVEADDQVVVAGAQQLLAAELQAGGSGEGD